jgi:type II secretory pathway pseudopilin PulG
MIELLVVIAVIGVLAVAVLSSINPIEQINKGRDTRTRSDAAQLINAVDRYYAIHEVYPWNVAAGAFTPASTVATTEYQYTGNDETTTAAATPAEFDWTTTLVSTAEVKEGFVNRLSQDNAISLFKATGSNETMYACFIPTSNAFKQEAWNNCVDGVTPAGTPVTGGVTPCTTTAGSSDPFDPAIVNYICLP